MTPLERAARALYDRLPHVVEWDDLSQSAKDESIDDARAVLEAIREPSEGMVEAGISQARQCTDEWKASAPCLPGHAWQAMIDAALAE